jgi:hypothetical protein
MVTNLISGSATTQAGGDQQLGKPSPPLAGDPAPIPPSLATYPSLPATPKTGGSQTQPSFMKPSGIIS